MRIAIVSDIHSNLSAFQALLRHAEGFGKIDAIWCLGDIVGYGPHPNECISLLRTYEHLAVIGNHGMAACGRMGTENFNDVAAAAVRWTGRQLTTESRSYLLALRQVEEEGNFTLVHGSLRSPEWEYLLSGEQARGHLKLQHTLYGLVGHSHLPFVCREQGSEMPTLRPASNGQSVELGDARLILNPGSAGQTFRALFEMPPCRISAPSR